MPSTSSPWIPTPNMNVRVVQMVGGKGWEARGPQDLCQNRVVSASVSRHFCGPHFDP
jgi:hypothetical protein